jgi:hypothetical protein
MILRHADRGMSLHAHLAEGFIAGKLRHEWAAVRLGVDVGSVGDNGKWIYSFIMPEFMPGDQEDTSHELALEPSVPL